MFLILSPTLVVPIITEVAAERRMYLPLAALITLAVVVGYWLVQQIAKSLAPAAVEARRRWPGFLAGAVAIILSVGLGVASAHRLEDYRDPITLWQNALASQPDNGVAHNNLGNALARKGRTQDAIEQFREALRLKPDFADAHYNLGLAFANSGQLQPAIDEYQRALMVRPSYAEGAATWQLPWRWQGGSDEAIQQFRLALQLEPKQANNQYNLGLALDREGRLPEAIECYKQALQLNPEYTDASINLAMAYAQLHHPQEALAAAQKALDLARSQGRTEMGQNLDDWLRDYRAQQTGVQTNARTSAPAPIAP